MERIGPSVSLYLIVGILGSLSDPIYRKSPNLRNNGSTFRNGIQILGLFLRLSTWEL